MHQAALDRDARTDGRFRSAIGLMCKQNRRLLLDAFVFVENLERVACTHSRFIIANELDLLAKLGLYLDEVALDTVFRVRLDPRTNPFMQPLDSSTINSKYLLPTLKNSSMGRRYRSGEA